MAEFSEGTGPVSQNALHLTNYKPYPPPNESRGNQESNSPDFRCNVTEANLLMYFYMDRTQQIPILG